MAIVAREAGARRRVGELAEAAGLTVRTLHYYEEIGLLVASARTESGHRLYGDADVARLYRICLLRRLGLPLGEISRALDDPAWNLAGAISAHVGDLDRRIAAAGRLRNRLSHLMASVASPDDLNEDLLAVLEEMTMLDTTVQRRISILVYADMEAAYEYLVRVFGLGPGGLSRTDDGTVVHGELQAGDGVVWLHPESSAFGLSSPRSLGAATASVAVMVDDVDAHFRRASEQGALIEYEPVDQPYGYREYSACRVGVYGVRRRGRHHQLGWFAVRPASPAGGGRGLGRAGRARGARLVGQPCRDARSVDHRSGVRKDRVRRVRRRCWREAHRNGCRPGRIAWLRRCRSEPRGEPATPEASRPRIR